MAGPYGLPFELDNTPRGRYENMTGMGPWCNPFGYESDVQVLGGVADAGREKHVWYCRNRVDGRYWLTCANGHRGRMALCYAHVYQIMHRMNGLCPRCAFPPAVREISESIESLTREWFSVPGGDRRASIGRRVEQLREELTMLYRRGEIKTGAPLKLTEVSLPAVRFS